jgi:hypothetical protein
MRRIALVTCATLPELDIDEQTVIAPLRAHDIEGVPAVWDDPTVDWSAFDLAVIRSTWDYTERRDAFVAWAKSVPRLANPADLIEWNTDKRYLSQLAAAGLPVVPTAWVDREPVSLPTSGVHVLKPAVGAGSIDAARFSLHDEHQAALAREHASRIVASGRTVMVQPYLDQIDQHGETALMYFGGVFSHAVTKGAMLAKKREMVDGLYYEETVAPKMPTEAELELGARVLAEVPGGPDRLLYARVDLVPDADGNPLLIELELTEPSLFLAHSPGAVNSWAEAIANSL